MNKQQATSNKLNLAAIFPFLTAITMFTMYSCAKDNEQLINDSEGLQLREGRDQVHLGRKLQNPYNIRIMLQAYNNVKRAGLLSREYSIIPDHFYIRFLPKSKEEFELLKNRYSIELFDYPLDYELIGEGDFSYHDSGLPNDNYTWQYTVIDLNEDLLNIQHEILDTVFLNEDDNYNLTIIRDNHDWKNVEHEAYRITNNLDSNEPDHGVGLFLCDEWTPDGYIKTHDDIVGGLIPLEGALVKVRRFLKIRYCFTDENGYYKTDDFCGEVNYSIKWEHNPYTIRDGLWLQAYFNGPKQKGNWNLNIGSGKSLRYATIHRAAFRYQYLNIGGLKRPNVWSSLKYCYWDGDGTGNNWGNWDFTGIFPDINIWGKNTGGNYWDTNQLYSTTIHETGHASHIELMNAGEIQFGQVTSQIYESWANTIEWYITQIEYNELGFSNYDVPDGGVEVDNMQDWDENDSHIYTPLFIDLVDNYNQSLHRGTQPTNQCPEGGSFDGSNCYIGTPPLGETAFILNETFYYTPVGCCTCPVTGSTYDGANCFIFQIPENSIGFINNNNWYLSPAGNAERPYDHIDDYTMGLLESNVIKHSYGLTSLRNILKTNKPTGVTDKEIDIYLEFFFNL